MEKQRRKIGDVIEIDLGDQTHVYGQVLADASYAIFDSRSAEPQAIGSVVRRPILFFIAVMDHAVKSGRWRVIGNLPLDEKDAYPTPTFMQDRFDKTRFQIYERGKIRPSTRAECVGLERAAVWEPEQVEDRIRDYYAGKRNRWLESLAPELTD